MPNSTPPEPASSAPVALHLEISGRVQRVGYRMAMQAEARALGLSGWVRNLRNGDVQALVQGPPAQVGRMLAWCRTGPPLARVTQVRERTQALESGWPGFVCRDTVDGG